MLWLAYLVTGSVGGFLGGLLGIGGGTVLVPALVAVYGLQGADRSVAGKVAIATSLATMILLSLSAAIAHGRRKSVGLLLDS